MKLSEMTEQQRQKLYEGLERERGLEHLHCIRCGKVRGVDALPKYCAANDGKKNEERILKRHVYDF